MGADGSDPVELRPAGLDGWVQQGHAEWSPDGTQLVMFGGDHFSPQIRITDALGQHPRTLTDRKGTNVDPSWSPDGRTIVFVGCPGSFCTPSSHEIYTIPATGGPATRLTHDGTQDNDPYFSHQRHASWPGCPRSRAACSTWGCGTSARCRWRNPAMRCVAAPGAVAEAADQRRQHQQQAVVVVGRQDDLLPPRRRRREERFPDLVRPSRRHPTSGSSPRAKVARTSTPGHEAGRNEEQVATVGSSEQVQ